jgi:hypothetical protein
VTNAFIARYSAGAPQPVQGLDATVLLSVSDVDNDPNVTLEASGRIALEPGTYSLRGSVGEVHGTGGPRWVTFAFFNLTDDVWVGTGGMVGDPDAVEFERGPTEASATIVVTRETTVVLAINRVGATGTIISGGAPAGESLWTDQDLTRAFVTIERRN